MGIRNSLHLVLVLAAISISVACERKPEADVVARINERAITIDEFREEIDKSIAVDPEFRGTSKDMEALVDELVTRELLIQEAMKIGLDVKPDFRRQIKRYYEQTLIEDMMRAKLSNFAADVTEEEIGERYKLMGRVYRVDVAQVEVPGAPGKCLRADEALWQKVEGGVCRYCHKLMVDNDMEVMLEYFPRDFSNAVAALVPGEVSSSVLLRGKFCYVKLKGVEQVQIPPLTDVREQIKDSLVKEKQSMQMEQWIRGLKDNADIYVNREALDEGLVK